MLGSDSMQDGGGPWGQPNLVLRLPHAPPRSSSSSLRRGGSRVSGAGLRLYWARPRGGVWVGVEWWGDDGKERRALGGVENTRMMTMLGPMLACCKLYISEGRNASALRAIERAARLHPRPAGAGAVLINRFTDNAYNRVGYTLVSPLAAETATSLTPLQHAVFGMVSAAFEAIDFGSHAGMHPRLGAVDHVCFHPLAQASLDQVAALARAAAADIGDKLQVPTFLYGAAHGEGRTLASIRRQLGYFKPDSSGDQWRGALDAETLPIAPDAGPERLSTSKGVTIVGATGWVDNYNVPVYTSDVEAVKRIARRVSERGGGLRSVQAMGLAHGGGVAEVACNLLDPGRVGAEQVQDRVQRLADAQGFSVGKGYFTDFSQEEIIELYFQSAKPEAS